MGREGERTVLADERTAFFLGDKTLGNVYCLREKILGWSRLPAGLDDHYMEILVDRGS